MRTDDEIQKEVVKELHRDPELRKIAAEIGVSVKNEVVTLFGTVAHHALRTAAEKAALRVDGVNVVALEIELKGIQKPTSINDTDIGEAIHKKLRADKVINKLPVDFCVEKGWISLEGIVNWGSERIALARIIERIPGVERVINKVTVKGKTLPEEQIETTILAELERYPFIDQECVEVVVVGTTVTLSGEVQTWKEREDAENISYSVPGVSKVINELTIDFEIYAN